MDSGTTQPRAVGREIPGTTRRSIKRLASVATAVIGVLVGLLLVAAPKAYAAGQFNSAAIADQALAVPVGGPGGQCWTFVQNMILRAGGPNISNQAGGNDYFAHLRNAGGTQIGDINALTKGDVVQVGRAGGHTFIIVGRVSGNLFDVVDSNHASNERVDHYHRAVSLTADIQAFRFGRSGGTKSARQPIGHLDEVRAVPGGAEVRGWAIDPDTDAPIQVHLYGGDGRPGVNHGVPLTANGSRPDVATAFPPFSADHGFSGFFPLASGRQTVCAYGIDSAGGVNPQLGCIAVAVDGTPIGSLDEVRPTSGGVEVRGWAIDPDAAAPIQVHVYGGDGQPPGNRGVPLNANVARPDVGEAYPRYGSGHGFTGFLPLAEGPQTVCVYGIDSAGGFSPRLGCKSVSVPTPAPKPVHQAAAPESLALANDCVRTGPCHLAWQEPDLGGGELAYYEIEAARAGRDLPTLHVRTASASYTGADFGSCGPIVVVVKAVTRNPGNGQLLPGKTTQRNTTETGCATPHASNVQAQLAGSNNRPALVVTFSEPTSGTSTCLIRVNHAVAWTGTCGASQAPRRHSVTIPAPAPAASYTVSVTVSNAQGSDTSPPVTVNAPPAPATTSHRDTDTTGSGGSATDSAKQTDSRAANDSHDPGGRADK